MYEKQIRKSCLAIGTRFREVYLDSHGEPSADFFACIARCLGGIKGYRYMSGIDLAKCIATKLEITDTFILHNRLFDEWFTNVIPALGKYFHRPPGTISDGFVPKFSDPEGEEGGRILKLHLKIERNASIVRFLKTQSLDRDALGFIFCFICRVAPGSLFGVEIIEAHHRLPLSKAGVRVVKAEDFILVCPNCHSSIHAGARIGICSSITI